jgi:hypothetical protein
MQKVWHFATLRAFEGQEEALFDQPAKAAVSKSGHNRKKMLPSRGLYTV